MKLSSSVVISSIIGLSAVVTETSAFSHEHVCHGIIVVREVVSKIGREASVSRRRRLYDRRWTVAFGVGEAGVAGGSGFGTLSSDPSVLSLLDGEQEKVTASRAELEETIVRESSASRDELLMPTEKERLDSIKWIKKCLKAESRSRLGKDKDSGAKSGFGAPKKTSKNKKNSKEATLKEAAKTDKKENRAFDPSCDPHGYGAVLQKDGVVRINNVLSRETAQNLATYIDQQKELYEQEVADGLVPELSRFTRVLLKKNRWDVLLPLFQDQTEDHSIIQQALHELLMENDFIANVIQSTLGSDAELYEFACLISDPGSDRQVFHPDIAFQGETQIRTGPLLTCFVALQDIDEQMGPTEFLPQTNTQHYHDLLNDFSKRDHMLSTVDSKLSLLRAGDCTIHDATTLHAGSANRSQNDQRRRLFYFTFRSLSMEDPRTWNNPGSIRPDLKDKHYSFQDIQKHLQSRKNLTS